VSRSKRRILAALVAGFGAIGLALSTAPAANAIPSPGQFEITLDMKECGLMYLGTVGSCIISLQTWMNWAVGHKDDTIAINGVYDQDTLRFVERFQAEYVPDVSPTGQFGDRSRAALRSWFEKGARTTSSHVPCNPGLGWGCDQGAAEPGLHPSVVAEGVETFVCTAVGVATLSGGVICAVTLSG
jgi:hypothetical protein